MKPNLNDEETAALIAELDHIIEDDRYPNSDIARNPCEIKPYPVRELLPRTRRYEPPRARGLHSCSCCLR